MKKILLLISIVFTSVLSVAQNTSSLPYYQVIQSRDTIVTGDTLIFHEESTGKYVKISLSDFKNAINSGIITIDSLAYIRRDGTSSATTDKILMGSGQGIKWGNNSSITGSNTYIQNYIYSGSDYTYFNQNQYGANIQSYGPTESATLQVSSALGAGVRTGGYFAYLKSDSLTANTTVQLQDTSGIVAYLHDIPAGSGVTSVTGTTNRITSTGGTTPVIDISSSYAGQSSINTVGTIGTGVWNAGAVTSSGSIIGLNYNATGSGGAGYLRLPFQTATPTAVSGSMILYSDGSNRFSIVRRNNANSADITRTHVYPDASYSWNFPTPASGSTSNLAGLETANTYTQTNTFPTIQGTSLQIFNGTAYVNALDVSGTDLRLGSAYTVLRSISLLPITNNVNNLGSTASTWNTVFSSNYTTNSATGISISTALATANSSGQIALTTGTQNSATANLFSGPIYLKTGDITNAGALSSQYSASIRFDVGTVAGSATRGGIVLFGGNTEPTWNGLQRGIRINNATAEGTVQPSSGADVWVFGNKLKTSQSLVFPFAGSGLEFKTGSNARVGTSTLTAGTITVSNTSVTANTKVKVQLVSVNGGTLGAHYLYTVNPGVGFTITSVNISGGTHVADVATVDWYLTEFN